MSAPPLACATQSSLRLVADGAPARRRRAEYINTFECVPNPISPLTGQQAWSYWYATCNTCKSRQPQRGPLSALRTLPAGSAEPCLPWPDVLYNSSYIDNKGKLIVEEGQYQTDTLGAQAIAQIHAAKELQKPFCKS